MARAVERRRSESVSDEGSPARVRVRGFSGSGLGQTSVEFDVRTLYDFVFSLSEDAGSTDDLPKRVSEHREKLRRGFTAKHGVAMLVWYEMHDTREAAFKRERRIKEWRRVWKFELIEKANHAWDDLFEKLF